MRRFILPAFLIVLAGGILLVILNWSDIMGECEDGENECLQQALLDYANASQILQETNLDYYDGVMEICNRMTPSEIQNECYGTAIAAAVGIDGAGEVERILETCSKLSGSAVTEYTQGLCEYRNVERFLDASSADALDDALYDQLFERCGQLRHELYRDLCLEVISDAYREKGDLEHARAACEAIVNRTFLVNPRNCIALMQE